MNAYRPDLADAALTGQVIASHYADPVDRVTASAVTLRQSASPEGEAIREMAAGEPFCMLDEVDAPLDDANVFRFNDLVREMAKRSQIIVVTHNKHTMEVAAKLYGVTMQERGVSTMVSVNVADYR